MENTMCGARADFQTAGLNGVFAHFCRRGQKWVAPERETSPCRLLKEMGPPEAGKGSAPRPQARNSLCAAVGNKSPTPERETAPFTDESNGAPRARRRKKSRREALLPSCVDTKEFTCPLPQT